MSKERVKANDHFVGLRVKELREAVGVTQVGLARKLEITVQQLQKYESGINRISSGRLYEIGRILEAPVQVFFDGIGEGPTEGATLKGRVRVMRALARLEEPQRLAVNRLIHDLAHSEEAA